MLGTREVLGPLSSLVKISKAHGVVSVSQREARLWPEERTEARGKGFHQHQGRDEGLPGKSSFIIMALSPLAVGAGEEIIQVLRGLAEIIEPGDHLVN